MKYKELYYNLKAKIRHIHFGEHDNSERLEYLKRIAIAYPSVLGRKWWWIYEAILERTELESIYQRVNEVGVTSSECREVGSKQIDSITMFETAEACDLCCQFFVDNNFVANKLELSRPSPTTLVGRFLPDSHNVGGRTICEAILGCATCTKFGQSYIRQPFTKISILEDIKSKNDEIEKLLHNPVKTLEIFLLEYKGENFSIST